MQARAVTDRLEMPSGLVEGARLGGRLDWLDTLTGTIRTLQRRWELELGAPYQPGGSCAWVAPCRDRHGRRAVLKVIWRHPEALHEAAALRLWEGDGAVKLYASEDLDEETAALLMERCVPGTPLAERAEPDQDLVVASLLKRLWRHDPAAVPFRPLQSMCDQWADEYEEKVAAGRGRLDPDLGRHGIALFRALPASASESVALCTDLHATNVLAAEREPWLVVDPKPYLGDPTYDALQHMLNCPGRLLEDPRALTGRMADLLELDRERLLAWLFARCVQESPDWPVLAEVAVRIGPVTV